MTTKIELFPDIRNNKWIATVWEDGGKFALTEKSEILDFVEKKLSESTKYII